MSEGPQNTVLRNQIDASTGGFYASLIAGGLMLGYAIYYVTVANVSNDYSFLTMGIITGLFALGIIALHEWFRHSKGVGRGENAIEEYAGATGVLLASLSAVWLSRFTVFFAGPENGWIEIQEGEVWMPIWLSTLQSVGILFVMEVSTRLINRHSLGTLPRFVVVLSPISLAFSAIPIWMDYSDGQLEVFLTLSFILLMSSSIIYSLRLNRSILYLFSCGMTVVLPLVLSTFDVEHASLMVPFVLVIGITATDQSLSRNMIQNSSGFVVAAILLCQILSTSETSSFVVAGLFQSPHPFGLTFWLWSALLVGWFAPTKMQRTPAMPVGLALALALLSQESAMIGWAVGIAAFAYLETREHARDWVVRATFAAMIASWWISSSLGSISEGNLVEFGEFRLSIVDGSTFVLLPSLLLLGMWAQFRGRFGFFDGPALLILAASLNWGLLLEATIPLFVIIATGSLFQLIIHLKKSGNQSIEKFLISAFVTAPIVLSLAFLIAEDPSIEALRLLPALSGLAIFVICHNGKGADENLMLRPELAAIMILILISLLANLNPESGLTDSQQAWLTVSSVAVLVSLLAFEGGAVGKSTPLERFVGIWYLLAISAISAPIVLNLSLEGVGIAPLVARDLLIMTAPVLVSHRLKTLTDLSQEARNFGTATLLLLLIIGFTDVSGGLLAIPVYSLAVYRASKHASTLVLATLPAFAILYSTWFYDWSLGIYEDPILWSILTDIPYLGEASNLLMFETPRWSSILLAALPLTVAAHFPAERKREGGSRFDSEQLFGPAMAALFSVAFLLPDERLAPPLIIISLSAVAWKRGVVHWFWTTPIGFYWAMSNIVSLSGQFFPDETPALSAGLAGLLQYLLLSRGILLRNVEQLEEIGDSIKYLGPFSRGSGYLFLLFTGGISGAIPFFSGIVAGLDGIKNGKPWLLHSSIFIQTFTLGSWFAHNDAFLWPVLVGFGMVILSWKKTNPYHELEIDRYGEPFNFERDMGLFGSGFFLFFLMLWTVFEGVQEIFGLGLVILSSHQVVLGFRRDDSWRRSISLLGLPAGFIVIGSAYGGLTMVVMLFLAALTMIGQGVLYSSRGGLEFGSTLEGSTNIASSVGSPEEKITNYENPSNTSIDDDIGDEKSEKETTNIEQDQILDPRFSSSEVPFQVRLDSDLLSRLSNSVGKEQNVDLGKWTPVLFVNSNGLIVLNWERAPIE